MKYVPAGITRTVSRQILKTQKNSPTLLFGAGVAGMVVTAVLASRATLKLGDILEDAQTKLEKVELVETSVEFQGKYTSSEMKRAKAQIYIRTSLEIGKIYAPAVIIGVVSISALASSHDILVKRNAALTAAYTALMESHNAYRDRVAAKYGREAEEEIYRELTPCEVEDEENPGKKKVVKKAIRGGSIYARLFDSNSKSWNRNPEYNVVFLRSQQNYANDLLQSRGHVFLNEIYDSLGLERSKEGAVVGWIKGQGDDYIDFGVFDDPDLTKFYEFAIGQEEGIWVDFNVDGVIYDKI
jgi:hypothetical protein